jgi:hypothetical protein
LYQPIASMAPNTGLRAIASSIESHANADASGLSVTSPSVFA